MRHTFVMVLFALLVGCAAGGAVTDEAVEGEAAEVVGTEEGAGEATETESVVNEAEPVDEAAEEAVEGDAEEEAVEEGGEEGSEEAVETEEGGE